MLSILLQKTRKAREWGFWHMGEKTGEKDVRLTARGFGKGIRAGLPIAFGYIPAAVACGLLAGSAGLTLAEAFFMSLIVFAGASQFVALNLIMAGAALPEVVLATAILNARLAMLSSSISRRMLPGAGVLKKAWIGFELTDESFSVASAREEPFLAPEFLMGLNLPGHFTWTSGTLLGFIGASIVPAGVQKSMGIAIYALFIGLLVPMIRKNRLGLVVALSAMALSALFKLTPFFSGLNIGVIIMLATGIAAFFGAYLSRRRRLGTQ